MLSCTKRIDNHHFRLKFLRELLLGASKRADFDLRVVHFKLRWAIDLQLRAVIVEITDSDDIIRLRLLLLLLRILFFLGTNRIDT